MKKILVIDDSPVVREQLGAVLGRAGFAVVEACDGLDAITKVDDTIGMMLCDVNMPHMNGLEMLEQLKADAKWTAVPVVMLTTEGHPSLILRAKKAGAKGWLVKPFNPEQLVATVRRFVS